MQLILDWRKSIEILGPGGISPIGMVNHLQELQDMHPSIHTWVLVRIIINILEQSRRDDLEALGYVFVYFCKGSLPWQGLKGDSKKVKYDAIMEKKITTSTQVLCQGLPKEFATYLDYVKSLRFEDTPDYILLRHLFRDLFISEGYIYDYVFDWVLVKEEKERAERASGVAKMYFFRLNFRIPSRTSSANQIISAYLPILTTRHQISPNRSPNTYLPNILQPVEQYPTRHIYGMYNNEDERVFRKTRPR
jgi:hypothetical protein